jgi:hypothetical protein
MFCWSLAIGAFMYLGYCVVFTALVEYLNHQRNYQYYYPKVLNLIFGTFLVTDISYRLLQRYVKPALVPYINIAEHLSFSFIVCTVLFLLLQFHKYFKRFTALYNVILAAILFNLVGYINELYQNLNHAAGFWLSAESIKDMGVNIAGSFLFIGIYLAFARKLRAIA